MLAAVHRQQEEGRQRRRRARVQQQLLGGEEQGRGRVTAMDASSNGLEALPLASPEARVVLHGLMELRLAHNCIPGDLGVFASLPRLIHLGACR